MNEKKDNRFLGLDSQEEVQALRAQVRCLQARLDSKDRVHPLTGLHLTAVFYHKAEALLRSASHIPYCVACLDVEHLKLYNELYGHEAGDRLLASIGRTLGEIAAECNGIAGYMGGDDFMLLIPQGAEENSLCAERMSQIGGLADSGFFMVAGAYSIRDRSLSMTQICDRARLAAAAAKGGYAFRLVWFDESMQQSLLYEQELMQEAHRGLAQDEFVLYAQPQCHLNSGEIIGMETLVRWNHPRKGLLPPEDFIPAFEKTRFISCLDAFVWERVCQYLRGWINAGYKPFPVAVNVSRLDLLTGENMPERLLALTRHYGIDPSLLPLEITETAYAENYDSLNRSIARLQSMGFCIMMDDFGSGYSSLSTLQDMNLDVIKLDKRLLDIATEDKLKGAGVLESMLRLARCLEIRVIAEGVKTEEQADLLRSIGCEYAQGYLFYQPMPIEDIPLLFRREPPARRGERQPAPQKAPAAAEDGGKTAAAEIGPDAGGEMEARQRLARLTENVPAAILEVAFGADGRLRFKVLSLGPLARYANSAKRLEARLNTRGGLWNYASRSELVGCRKQLYRAYEAGAPLDTDFCISFPRRESCWLNLKGKRLINADGSPVLLCVLTDVSRLKNQDHPPWLLNKQFRSVMRQAGLNIWEYDYASQKLYLMCVADCKFPDPDHPLFAKGDDLMVDNFPANMKPGLAATAQDEATLRRVWHNLHAVEPMRAQFCLTHKDGRPLWLEVVGETICADNGQPLRDIGYFRDISMEKERQQVEQANRLLLQKLEEGTLHNLRVNLTNDRIFLNPSGIQLLKEAGNSTDTSYSQCMSGVCSATVLPPFQQQVRHFLDRNRLLEAFEVGEIYDRMEYQRFYEGVTLWCQMEYHMARQEETGDVYGYIFIKDIEARKQREQLLKLRAEIDGQSGLYNRQAGQERIQAALANTLQAGGVAGLLMCDLDNFKCINDTWGHAYGDEAIADTGRLLRSIFYGTDVLCRMGGDEFLAYCPGASRQEMEDRARRLCAGAREIRVGEGGVPLTLSAGVVMVPDQGRDFETLYPLADAMLYVAKAKGKNTYCFPED